jgi:hypothetical protein
MTQRIAMRDWPYILHRLGVSYYDRGTIDCKNTGVKLFDFYRADRLRPAQRRAIQRLQRDVQFMSSRSEYAPEVTSGLVCIPKAAFYRQTVKTAI